MSDCLFEKRPDGVGLITLAMAHERMDEPVKARQCYEESMRRWDKLGVLSSHRQTDLETLRAEARELLGLDL